jgi:hypothetical protein
MVPVDSNGISPVPPYSGYPPTYKTCPYGAFTLYGTLSQVLPVHFIAIMQALQPRSCRNMAGLGSSHFARHYSGNHYYFLFLRVLRCFSSPGSPPIARIFRLHRNGLSHSETCGSIPICGSPQLIAAYCVLHRL